MIDLGDVLSKLQRFLFPKRKEPISISGKTVASGIKRSNPTKKPTDDELAQAWLAKYPNTAYGLGEFQRYNDGVWNVLPKDKADAEILQELISEKGKGVRPTKSLLESVQGLARVQVSVSNELWDSDPDNLPCRNGVLHIPTTTLFPHSPGYYFSSQLSYDYDPLEGCPNYLEVLETTIPDATGFFQEFAGYCLTTDTRYEIAVWLSGPPGSGKSTTLSGLQALLGSRAGLLGLADIERSRFALTNLPGKTLVVATENPATYLKATHTLNTIISGEPIEIDRKFRDPVTVYPRAKIAWAMNELPRVGDGGNGLFRRVKIIRFPALPEDKQNPALKEAIKLEGAGILNWALEGLSRLNARGSFAIPATVEAATNHFQESNDIPALYVAERCETGPDLKVQSSLLYRNYKSWCDDYGHKAQSITSIAEDWRRLGFERSEVMGLRYWRGVSLKQMIKI
jgi:P4 family phage/plasmid primase-like protien